MVNRGRGCLDPSIFPEEPSLQSMVRELVQACAVLAIRIKSHEAKLQELEVGLSHIDFVEGETDTLRSGVERMEARIDSLVRMLTEPRT